MMHIRPGRGGLSSRRCARSALLPTSWLTTKPGLASCYRVRNIADSRGRQTRHIRLQRHRLFCVHPKECMVVFLLVALLAISAKPTTANNSLSRGIRWSYQGVDVRGEYRPFRAQARDSQQHGVTKIANRDKRACGVNSYGAEYTTTTRVWMALIEDVPFLLEADGSCRPSSRYYHEELCPVISFTHATRPEPSNARPRLLVLPRLQHNSARRPDVSTPRAASTHSFESFASDRPNSVTVKVFSTVES